MRQDHIEASRKITTELLDLEAQIDATIASGGRFPATMVEARLQAKLPAAAGHEALIHAAKAFELMVQARKHVIQAHASLAATATDYGIAPVALGDGHLCPEKAELLSDEPARRLTVVA